MSVGIIFFSWRIFNSPCNSFSKTLVVRTYPFWSHMAGLGSPVSLPSNLRIIASQSSHLLTWIPLFVDSTNASRTFLSPSSFLNLPMRGISTCCCLSLLPASILLQNSVASISNISPPLKAPQNPITSTAAVMIAILLVSLGVLTRCTFTSSNSSIPNIASIEMAASCEVALPIRDSQPLLKRRNHFVCIGDWSM